VSDFDPETCDEYILERHHQVMLDAIIDHKSDHMPVLPDDGFTTLYAKRHLHNATRGWELCIQGKNGEPLSDLKEAYPVQTAEYAIANKLEHQPAFVWWAGTTLRRRDRIIVLAMNKRYQKGTHKFGNELAQTAKEVLEINQRNGTNYWKQALDLEMKNVRVACSMFLMII
jgi:hypothetical protein